MLNCVFALLFFNFFYIGKSLHHHTFASRHPVDKIGFTVRHKIELYLNGHYRCIDLVYPIHPEKYQFPNPSAVHRAALQELPVSEAFHKARNVSPRCAI